MRCGNVRAVAIALLGLALLMPAFPGVQLSVGVMGGPGGQALVPVDDPLWAGSFEDMSRVYVPPGGLVGLEVASGEVHLLPGSSEGWLASSIITCPDDFRFDLVLVEADTPGDSRVEISILDATAEASEVGFANETVPNFKRVPGTALSVYSINPITYPEIRIQLNLVADGANHPTVTSWALHFVPKGEWNDEFLGPWKLSEIDGLNLTDGVVEIDLTRKGAVIGNMDYKPYPTLFSPSYYGLDIYYTNSGANGYEDASTISSAGGYGVAVADLNGDGYLDVTTAKIGLSSTILWGSSTGTYSETGAHSMDTPYAYRVAAGDFNADGELDLVFACDDSSAMGESLVFLNQGDGEFNSDADIEFYGVEFMRVDAADMNNDDIDDIIFHGSNGLVVYYGSVDGPDTTADVTYYTTWVRRACIDDVNDDGYLDICAAESTTSIKVFLGGPDGPDTTADHTVSVEGFVMAIAAGDVNGDTHVDILYSSYISGGYKMTILKGDASGWSSSRYHRIDFGWAQTIKTADLDKDGIEDIIASAYNHDGTASYYVLAYLGDTAWPSNTPDVEKAGNGYFDIAAAIPEKESKKTYGGSLVTKDISLPDGSAWDMLDLDGTVPQNTTVTVSILDSSDRPIAGYKDLDQMNIDLSAITFEQTIKVKVTLRSEFNNTTPSLDRMVVKWMDRMMWRDEFYGDAKVDRLLKMAILDETMVPAGLTGNHVQFIFASMFDPAEPGTAGASTGSSNPGGTVDILDGFPDHLTSAVDVADVDGDGYMDVVFARYRQSSSNYHTKSPLFMGHPVGWRNAPDHEFPTVGAADVLLEDLNGDGYTDVVFAQEQNDGAYIVDSTMFWGGSQGWSATPDISFKTHGATDVEAVDIDGDGMLDLVFSCFKFDSTSTDSMVFLQEAAGFCGTVPDHRLPTMGAMAVATGDIDGDGHVDLAFANYFSAGATELDSYVYWGASGGFDTVPTKIPTKGAHDVELVDLDRDGDLDIVFADRMDNSQNTHIGSPVYLLDGTRSIPGTPSHLLPTNGASAVSAADVDGEGWMDLTFACQPKPDEAAEGSRLFISDGVGWPTEPSMFLPTVAASDVVSGQIMKRGQVGYLSERLVFDPAEVGNVDTLRYVADLGTGIEGRMSLVDSQTWEELASTPLEEGDNEWDVSEAFKLKEHGSIQVMVAADGLQSEGDLRFYLISLNWTHRVHRPPEVRDFVVSEPQVLRTQMVRVVVDTFDEFDPAKDLRLTVNHRLNGTDEWGHNLISKYYFQDGSWVFEIRPKVDAQLGTYDFRVRVRDTDDMLSGDFEFDNALEVLNNVPTQPEVRVTPNRPVSTHTLVVEMVKPATDVENSGLSYRYQWYRDGEMVEDLTSDSVPWNRTNRGENWTVEVWAFDGMDDGPVATGWKVIQNAAPQPVNPLPDPEMEEDSSDSDWLDLSTAFEDPDGDPLSWALESEPAHFDVLIDPATGRVTLVPEENWNGEEEMTFVASDGELSSTQTVTVVVTPVNDAPVFISVDGEPIATDPVTYTILQGQVLIIRFDALDVEGHQLLFDINSSMVALDADAREIRFEPDNDAVGTLRFGLKMYDVVDPDLKVPLNFVIEVVNENDPMDDPVIKHPDDGTEYTEKSPFYLSADCFDPDMEYGQELNFSWSSSISGHLGYGSTLTLSIEEVGDHIITLTVTDGEFQKVAQVSVTIKPEEDIDPDPDPDPDPTDQQGGGGGIPTSTLLLLVVALLGAAGAAGYVAINRRRAEDEDLQEPEGMGEREALKRMADMAREAADAIEESKNGDGGSAVWVETEDMDGIEVASASVADTQISMQAQVTKEAPSEVQALFADIERNGFHASEEDAEQLRIDNLKRTYHNAIGRLPYGIPSKELAKREWTDLAAALATGEKKVVEGGIEVTNIDGRWYYSDHKDTGTFLKEHGVKPAEAKARPAGTGRADLLAKLEERFILGEISEESYKELKQKFEEDR